MHRLVTTLFAVVLAVGFAGCATIITGTSTDVSIDSDPPDAEIEINGQDYGETPATVSLDSDRSHVVSLSLEGYEEETIRLNKGTTGWVVGNLLFGGIPGLLIDLASGGIYVLSPESVFSDLDETSTSSSKEVRIQVAMSVKEDLPKIGQLTPTSK